MTFRIAVNDVNSSLLDKLDIIIFTDGMSRRHANWANFVQRANEVLLPYNCKFEGGGPEENCFLFDSEPDYMLFLLRLT